MSLTSGDQNNAASTDPRHALVSKLLQFDVSKMSLDQIYERAMLLTRAMQQLRQRQLTAGTDDSVAHQEKESQILRLEKLRVILLDRYRALSQAKQTQASSMANSSAMPQMQMAQTQAQRLQSQNSAVSQAPAKPQANAAPPQFQTQAARISAMEQVTSMVQMGMTQPQIQAHLQILRNKAAAQAPSGPQMNAAPAPAQAQKAYMFASQHASSVRQMQMSQLQMQSQQSQSGPVMQTPPVPRMQLSSANLEKLNQSFTQSNRGYKPPLDSLTPARPDPAPLLPRQAPRMRSRSGAPKQINLPEVRLSPSATPFSMAQSSESEGKQSFTGPVEPEVCYPLSPYHNPQT
jgi:hypothetical protein